MNVYDFKQDLALWRQRNNQFLTDYLASIDTTPSNLADAMRYAVLLGGKRLRPFLIYRCGLMLGADIESLDVAAAAIELIHCYSLIHDDLPAMDDDDLRRGQISCHKKYDEATAILAGDALQSLAFELLADCPKLSIQQQIQLVKTLANASGAHGMCRGQSLDLFAESQNIDVEFLSQIHQYKTGALIHAAVMMGFICSPHFNNSHTQAHLSAYANAIGLAFQIQDDILDITSNTATLGKNVGSDLIADKSTYPKLLGLTGAQQKAQQLIHIAKTHLNELNADSHPLHALADYIIGRDH